MKKQSTDRKETQKQQTDIRKKDGSRETVKNKDLATPYDEDIHEKKEAKKDVKKVSNKGTDGN